MVDPSKSFLVGVSFFAVLALAVLYQRMRFHRTGDPPLGAHNF